MGADEPTFSDLARIRERLSDLQYPVPLHVLLSDVSGDGQPHWLFGSLPKSGKHIRDLEYFAIGRKSPGSGIYAIVVELTPSLALKEQDQYVTRANICYISDLGITFYADDWPTTTK
jgi:hypothetical protein